MSTIFGQIKSGVISANQQRTLNRMRRARNNPGAPGTPRPQLFRFTRNVAAAASPTRKRSRTRSRSGTRSRSRSGSRKRRKSSHH
uniref:Uncharacterized protein n=1 Tax=viral metagenome TaxID=1070528 RepID=A0A6C0D4M6_9ZZZZ